MQVLNFKHMEYLINTHPNQNIQEVGLAHPWIDEVMWYCLRINQACVFNYALIILIVYMKTTVKK